MLPCRHTLACLKFHTVLTSSNHETEIWRNPGSMSVCPYMHCAAQWIPEPRLRPPSPRGQTPPGRELGHPPRHRPPQLGTASGSVWLLHAAQTLLLSYKTSAQKHTHLNTPVVNGPVETIWVPHMQSPHCIYFKLFIFKLINCKIINVPPVCVSDQAERERVRKQRLGCFDGKGLSSFRIAPVRTDRLAWNTLSHSGGWYPEVLMSPSLPWASWGQRQPVSGSRSQGAIIISLCKSKGKGVIYWRSARPESGRAGAGYPLSLQPQPGHHCGLPGGPEPELLSAGCWEPHPTTGDAAEPSHLQGGTLVQTAAKAAYS